MAITAQVTLPEEFVRLLGVPRHRIPRRIKESLVLQLFIEERISAGKAAELLGLRYSRFLALLRSRKVALRYGARDLMADAKTLRRALA